ncbi:MAG TPA: hypothetical protein DCQ96_01895 [Verrucomicrobiales bacterium]|nr:hypothetical protein [Verrucomicrobiales bacterium]
MAVGDVRGVLQYVPMFRERTFVVVFDEGLPESAVAEALLDLKVLQGIGVNLVIAVAGGEESISVVADRALDLEIKFARVMGEETAGPILERGQAAIVNCPADGPLGESLADLGVEIGAAKLIGLLNGQGIRRDGLPLRAVPCSALPDFLDAAGGSALTGAKLLEDAAAVCRAGVPRVHILDGRQQGVLADELFSNEGVGTMVHADSYRDVRALREDDVPELLAMIGRSVRASHLVPRDYEEILQKADDFLVLCVDDNVVGCVALHCYGPDLAELACLYVKQSHECRGYGKLLVQAAEERARERNIHTVFALTTRAVTFFENLGYRIADSSVMPEDRARKCEESERSSAVLTKELA